MDAYGMDEEAWRAWAGGAGLPAFRGNQIFAALQRGAKRYAVITALPTDLRARLETQAPLDPGRETQRQDSRDGTVKSVLTFADHTAIECVSLPERTRHTICVSTQAGCAIGCSFCASGRHGLRRDLRAGEIVRQVLHHHAHRPVTNVVFMGAGEPLFNLDAVLAAIRILGHPHGLGLGRRRFTVSTAGVVDGIARLAEAENQVTLALSLHAPDDTTRDRLVPLNRRWPLAKVLAAVDAHAAATGRRPTLEYCLLADANMADDQARALGRLARTHRAHVNLIPGNDVTGTPHQAPSTDAVERFRQVAEAAGAHCTVRTPRGADIAAACGQLLGSTHRDRGL